METKNKKLKIICCNSTLSGLPNNTKLEPLQTHETLPLKWSMRQIRARIIFVFGLACITKVTSLKPGEHIVAENLDRLAQIHTK